MLQSLNNSLVKQLRKLGRSTERRKQGRFLLEGTNLLTTVAQLKYELEVCFCTEQWLERHPQLGRELEGLTERWEVVTREIIESIATTVNPDGIIGVSRSSRPTLTPYESLQLGLIFDRIQDPGNLGTIIRTAVATGVDKIWLSEDSVDLENPKVLRSSVGEWFKVSIDYYDPLSKLVQIYQEQGVQIIATTAKAEQLYWDIDFTRPTIILMGNESGGLSPELLSLADRQVKLPLQNNVESLNVSIATALILYESQRQRTFS